MKKSSHKGPVAFTLVELLVVVAIIGIMMSLTATVLRDPGTGRTLDSGIDLVTSMIQEARATAQGNDTYARLVIADDPKDTARDSRHLRYMVVQRLKRNAKENGTYDASAVDTSPGTWISTSAGNLLPVGVYFSPTYSRTLGWAENAGTKVAATTTRLSSKARSRVYYFEFDEKGRFVSPGAGPASPSQPQRIVLIHARRGTGRNSIDGLVPLQLDSHRRPVGAKGIVVWPSGYTTPMRTQEQVFQN